MASENFDKKIYLPVIGVLVVVIAALLIRFVFTGSKEVNAKVSKNKLVIHENFNFEDNSSFAKKWKWEFGDGVISYDRGGQYRYTQPGNYKLRLTINDEYTDTFYVSVRDTTTISAVVQDSLMRIEGPVVGMQFENIIFKAYGKGASMFRWNFGDAKTEDTRDPFVSHMFEQPGNYTVELHSNINQYPVQLPIKILPAFQGGTGAPDAGDKLRAFDDDFKIHLQKIADHKDFDFHYRYLVNKYLCNNEKVAVMINGQTYNEFFSYCAGLHYDKNIYIQQVKVAVDTSLTCVTRVEVSQQKQNL